MNNSISKSVLGFVGLGILLIGFVVWWGFHRKSVDAEASSLTVTQNVPASVPPTVLPRSVSGTDKSMAAFTKGENNSLAVIPISLTNIIDAVENDFLLNHDTGLKELPYGTQVYGGIEFWLQGMLHLQGQVSRDDEHGNFRTRVIVPLDETNFTDGKMTVTQRGKNIACVYLVGGTRFGTQTGEKFADLVWHYADGTVARNEMDYDVHLRDWWRPYYEDPQKLPGALTKVAWHGLYPGRNNGSIRLYRIAFVNPRPEKTITTLEFVSALARPSLFIMALTLDPLMPGARPDSLTSDEVPDPDMKNHLQLLVEDSDGHPLPNSKITVVTRAKENGYLNRKFTTDDNGIARVSYPDIGLELLDVSAEHDGFSGRKIVWEPNGGETMPASYTLKLGAEVKIGGVVMNEEGDPVSGAEIHLSRFWRGGEDDPNKPGEQPAFTSQQQTTDAAGHWQAGGLPVPLLGNISFEIKHPDYLRAHENVGENSTTEKQLRATAFKTVLKRGLIVRGRVLDAVGNPVPAAKVTAGKKYYSDTQQTTADEQGRFFFSNVKEGDVIMSVVAQGLAAASKNIKVFTNMPEVFFNLQAGNIIRGHVQDESGQPVAGAHIGLENTGMDNIESVLDYSTTTDDNGDFNWDGAPNATLTLYVFHEGFEQKRDAKVSPNQDNVITLRRTRTLQGLVLDDTTEQPVTKFTIRTGKASPNSDNVYGVIRYKSFTADDGRFTMSVQEEEDNAILIMADGYSDKVEKFPNEQDKTVQLVIRLKPAASLSGVVLAPDGSPAPGVTVAASGGNGPQHYVQLTGGRLRSYDSQTKVATTDEQGRFKLGTVPDDGLVVAAGEPGFARVSLAEVKNNATIPLQLWGRIEGVLHSGGQPAPGKDLLFTLQIPGVGTDLNSFKATTDDQGKFTMEKIPSGEGSIVRLIQTAPNSWSHSDSTTVDVKPGETTQVSLGDNGALVAGRYRYSFQPTNDAPLQLEGYLTLQVTMPALPRFNSSDEAQAFFKSPEWLAAAKLQKHYTLELKPDGSFTAENVVPGNYSLNINSRAGGERSWEHPPIAQGNSQVNVPDSFNPSQPVDVGEVLLNPVNQN